MATVQDKLESLIQALVAPDTSEDHFAHKRPALRCANEHTYFGAQLRSGVWSLAGLYTASWTSYRHLLTEGSSKLCFQLWHSFCSKFHCSSSQAPASTNSDACLWTFFSDCHRTKSSGHTFMTCCASLYASQQQTMKRMLSSACTSSQIYCAPTSQCKTLRLQCCSWTLLKG